MDPVVSAVARTSATVVGSVVDVVMDAHVAVVDLAVEIEVGACAVVVGSGSMVDAGVNVGMTVAGVEGARITVILAAGSGVVNTGLAVCSDPVAVVSSDAASAVPVSALAADAVTLLDVVANETVSLPKGDTDFIVVLALGDATFVVCESVVVLWLDNGMVVLGGSGVVAIVVGDSAVTLEWAGVVGVKVVGRDVDVVVVAAVAVRISPAFDLVAVRGLFLCVV